MDRTRKTQLAVFGLLGLGVVILIIIAVSLATKSTPVSPNTAGSGGGGTATATFTPQSGASAGLKLAYAHVPSAVQVACPTKGLTLYTNSLRDGSRKQAGALKRSEEITFGVHKSQVFVVAITFTDKQCSASKLGIWYSQDGGASYRNIYSVASSGDAKKTGAGLPDQITSARFSGDGQRIIFGYLPAGSKKNMVKEVDPATKSVKTLFSVSKPGVFLKGYDRKNQKVYYYGGCYGHGCDGNKFHTLRVHDLAKGKSVVLLKKPKAVNDQTIFYDDFSRILLVREVPSSSEKHKTQLEIDSYDVPSKHMKTLSTLDKPPQPGHPYHLAGLRADNGEPYYVKGNRIYGISGNASNPLYKPTRAVDQIYYASKDLIVAQTGQQKSSQVIAYEPGTKQSNAILKVNDSLTTSIFGITGQP